jgi:FdhE protein
MTDTEKLKRIEELQRERGLDREALELLNKLIRLRIDVKKRIDIVPIPAEPREKRLSEGEPLVRREELVIDVPQAVRHWRDVEKVFREQGIAFVNEVPEPEHFIREALEEGGSRHHVLEGDRGKENLLRFILLEVLKPMYETYAEAYGKQLEDARWVQPYCYVCGGSPDMAMLTGDGGKRYLCCSLCDTGWWYAKLKCPYCGNEDVEKLVSMALENEPSYMIHGCKACNCYIKVVDKRVRDGDLFLELEDLRTSNLDDVARREGFTPH